MQSTEAVTRLQAHPSIRCFPSQWLDSFHRRNRPWSTKQLGWTHFKEIIKYDQILQVLLKQEIARLHQACHCTSKSPSVVPASPGRKSHTLWPWPWLAPRRRFRDPKVASPAVAIWWSRRSSQPRWNPEEMTSGNWCCGCEILHQLLTITARHCD